MSRFASALLRNYRQGLIAGYGAVLLAVVHVPASSQSSYKEIEIAGGGSITGTVHLKGDPSIAERLEITKDKSCCGSVKVCPRLVVNKSGGVKNAVIYLDRITEGKKFAASPKALLNQKKCEYDPHVMVLPQGTQMDIVNNDPILHNVHAYCGAQSTFNIAQPLKGQRTCIKQTQLAKPGIIGLTCDAGHPWMSGFLFVVPHPYYAITDKNGNFRLDDVPPGTYTLKMWHEGVTIVNRESEKGKVMRYIFEEPYEESKEVTIGSGAAASADFDLTLRK